MPTAILDVDLSKPLPRIGGLDPFSSVLILVRVAGRPVGVVRASLRGGSISETELEQIIAATGAEALWRERIRAWVAPETDRRADFPSATVAVCTRDRPEDLRRCLDGVMAMPDDGAEFIVVDNAPATDATRELVARYPRVRYVREELPGLNRARNRALAEARHDVVAFLDDDSVPDPGWLRALLGAFDDPLVLCVTGLTMPLELETRAQEWFESLSTFNRGFARRTFDLSQHDPLAAGGIGAGVNMALRRSVLTTVGGFVPALDAGTPTHSGGDHEMMSRILRNGYRIVYEPAALNWHRHRRTWPEARKALYGYGVGVYAVFTHHLVEHRELGVLRLAWLWFRDSHARNLLRIALRRRSAPPLSLVLAELAGCSMGPFAYFRSRRLTRAATGAGG